MRRKLAEFLSCFKVVICFGFIFILGQLDYVVLYYASLMLYVMRQLISVCRVFDVSLPSLDTK